MVKSKLKLSKNYDIRSTFKKLGLFPYDLNALLNFLNLMIYNLHLNKYSSKIYKNVSIVPVTVSS